MSRATYDHEHMYKAINNKRRVYKCIKEGCPHTMNASLMVGRKAKCPECHAEIIITPEHLIRQNIACIGCGTLFGSQKAIRKVQEEKPLDIGDLLDRAKTSMGT